VAQKNIRAEQVKANKTDLYTYNPDSSGATLPYLALPYPTKMYIYICIYTCARLRNVASAHQVTNQKKKSWERFSQAFHLPLP